MTQTIFSAAFYKAQIQVRAVTLLLVMSGLCNGALTLVDSYTDNNGFYSYTVSSADAPFLFGGDSNLCFQIQSYAVNNIIDPPGWISTINPDEIVCWRVASNNVELIDDPLVFSLNSTMTDWTTYDEVTIDATYPKGIVVGDVYNTNGTLYNISRANISNGLVSSVNIAGYERFSFIGPIIPEPAILTTILFALIFIFNIHRSRKN